MLIFIALPGKWKVGSKLSMREGFILKGFQFYCNVPASRVETLKVFVIGRNWWLDTTHFHHQNPIPKLFPRRALISGVPVTHTSMDSIQTAVLT